MLGSLLGQPQNVMQVETSTWGAWPGDELAATEVNRTTSLQLLAVYGSVRLITDGICTLPVDVYEANGEDRIETAKPRWLDNPAPGLNYEEWCSQVLVSLLLDGNAYLGIGRDSVGRVVSVEPLDPAQVSVDRGPTGRAVYQVAGREIPANTLLHVRGMMLPGDMKGMSPIEYARRTIGLGLNAVDYGSEFFAGEGNMPGVIMAPHPMEPNTAREVAKQWQRKRRKGGRGLPGVLWNGATWHPTGVNHEQAQFLATRKFTAAEIAGQMFLVDPSDLGIPVEGTSLTYSNLQDRNTRRVQVTFLPWIIRLERAMSALTYGPNRQVKLNVNGLLRGDQTARFGAYAIGIDKGFLGVDEIRSWEDLPPRTDLAPTPPSPLPGEEL